MRTIEIPCRNGVILIDEDDAERVGRYGWSSYLHHGKICYALTRVRANGKRTNLLLHRFIMNAVKGQQVDHKNGNGLDCRKENLRFCTNWQNSFNRNDATGITYSSTHITKPWRATIHHAGKSFNLGNYKTKEEALAAHDGAARLVALDFARMNVGSVEPAEEEPQEAQATEIVQREELVAIAK